MRIDRETTFIAPHALYRWYATALSRRDKIFGNYRRPISSYFTAHWTTHKCFYRSANAMYGKIERTASEEVVLQLLNSK